MDSLNSIKITNPENIISDAKKVSYLFESYSEESYRNMNEILETEYMINEAKRVLENKRNGLYAAYEKTKNNSINSKQSNGLLNDIKKELIKCEELLASINGCCEEYADILTKQKSIINNSKEMYNMSYTLFEKIEVLMLEIINLK